MTCVTRTPARRLLYLPVGAGALPDADWSPLLDADRAAARQDTATKGVGRYRTVTFASGQTARWWVLPWAERDFVFLLDITAQQCTEQAGRALINDLGHELRTPIATILTHLEILGLSDVGQEVQQQSLTFAKDEAQRMARLLNDMLELGRLETAPELPRRPVDLVALVEEVVLQSTPRAVERQMALALEAESPLPRESSRFVPANADRLRQVFLNLLDNAFKYARPGDRVTVSLRRAPDGDAGGGVACAGVTSAAERDVMQAILAALQGKGELGEQYIQLLIAQQLKDNSKWIISGGSGDTVPVIELRTVGE